MKSGWWKLVLVVGISLTLNACSSSKTKEGEDSDVIPPSSDAGTDVIPQPSAENPGGPKDMPEPPGDSSMPPSDSASSSSPPGSGVMDSYAVQNGDTLMKIAFETYGDVFRWKEIYDANKERISNPNSIPAGTRLKVEKPAAPISIERNGEKYLIKTGDTLGKISGAVYGTQSKWKKIWENNKQLIHNPNKIFAGFYLYYVREDGTPSNAPTPQGGLGAPPAPASVPAGK